MLRVISIDCGYRNLATSLGIIRKQQKIVVEHSDVTDVLEGKKKRSNHSMVTKVLLHLLSLMKRWNIQEKEGKIVIICEQQVKGCNIPIGYGVLGLFTALYPQSDFIFMPAKKKFLGAKPTRASNMKEAAVQEVNTMLKDNHKNVTLLPPVRKLYVSLRKKDDISDTILQIQSFAYQNNYLPTITISSSTTEKKNEPRRANETSGDLIDGSSPDRDPDQ